MAIRAPQLLRTTAKACKQHETRIVTIVTMMLIGIVSFVVGMMTQSAVATAPLVVEYDASVAQMDKSTTDQEVPMETNGETDAQVAPVAPECKYVGSKNSTKYYPPTCSFAGRIAPKNLRCFTSDEDAQAKGYTRSTGC